MLVAEPAEVAEVDACVAVDRRAALAVALCPVERAVREVDEFARSMPWTGTSRSRPRPSASSPCSNSSSEMRWSTRFATPSISYPFRAWSRSAKSPPRRKGLAAGAQAGRHLGEHLVADRVAERVVHVLEVVDVHEADAQRAAGSGVEVALQALVEVAMVAEPGERVGQRQPHRAERTRTPSAGRARRRRAARRGRPRGGANAPTAPSASG